MVVEKENKNTLGIKELDFGIKTFDFNGETKLNGEFSHD